MKQWGLTPLFHFCGWKFVKGLKTIKYQSCLIVFHPQETWLLPMYRWAIVFNELHQMSAI